MLAEPFRFIHAADFHLEQPVCGLSEIPEHLRQLLIDAPYLAAEKVFDTAIAEEIDFVVLSGDILECNIAGPRGISFLLDQFNRLQEKNIAVYWAGGQIDSPTAWPKASNLPRNVRTFSHVKTEEITHYRGDLPLAGIIGKSRQATERLRPADFRIDSTDQFTIAMAHGSGETEIFAKQKLSYWALGGQHNRSTPAESLHTIHYPGSPQGRSPGEPDAHGCTLVEVNQHGHASLQFVPVDVLRWHGELLHLEENSSLQNLRRQLSEAANYLLATAGNTVLLVAWVVEPTGSKTPWLQAGPVEDELLAWLRDQFGQGQIDCAGRSLWSASIELKPAANLSSQWVEEDTILGDFMRGVQQFQENPRQPIELDHYLSPPHAAGTLGAAVAFGDADHRNQALLRSAELASQLLQGDSPTAAPQTS